LQPFASGISKMSKTKELAQLTRIAEALARIAPAPAKLPIFAKAQAFIWNGPVAGLGAVAKVNRVDIGLLKGVDQSKETLLENTRRFAKGLPANNALLWGARGMGKSSLVKATHAKVASEFKTLKVVEIHREDIGTLPQLMAQLRAANKFRFIVFCDDLSFDADDTSYKSLKAALDGGLEGRPENVIFYATSNRRHLLPRDMIENERSTAISPSEAVQEKVSLSDRFGLWLGFHHCSQEDYFGMVHGYAKHFGLKLSDAELEHAANEWSVTRGARSGRVAWQFIQDLGGRLGVPLRS
jgi:uncharacterized protein